jgi:hypothetical protein
MLTTILSLSLALNNPQIDAKVTQISDFVTAKTQEVCHAIDHDILHLTDPCVPCTSIVARATGDAIAFRSDVETGRNNHPWLNITGLKSYLPIYRHYLDDAAGDSCRAEVKAIHIVLQHMAKRAKK